MSKLLGPVRQVGYIVKDIEKAMASWIAAGVGPWFYSENLVPIEFRYRGQASGVPIISMALANSGDVQIELIQQINDAPSLYLETLVRNGECAQHVAYWTMDRYQEFQHHLTAQGFIEGHAGRMTADRGPFAYFIHPDVPSLMIEISDNTGGKAEYFEQVRQASIGWDGRDPVRRTGAK
ncbi:MAG TPA: VOC family protein [Burkholderiaceae bacterium]|nr:VOC family protein [Burkholderiaceae bacterium]